MKTHATQKLIKNAILLGLTPLLLRLAAPSAFAQAGPYYWDNNGTTAGFGTAGGVWSPTTTGSSTLGWSTSSTGATLPGTVTTATTDLSENFGSTTAGLAAGTVTVGGLVSAGSNIVFSALSGAITLSGVAGTTTNITLPATATITVNNAADTISSVLAGAGTSLAKTGSGTLTLSGAETFTGSLNVSNGTVSCTGGSCKTVNLTVASGATFSTTVNNYFGSTSWAGTWVIGGTFTGNAAAGNAAVTMPASVILTNGGVLNGPAYATYGTFLFGSATTITSGGTNTMTGGNLGLGAALTLNTPLATDALNVSSYLGASSAKAQAVTKTGLGTVTLSGANIYTGITTVSAGELKNSTLGSSVSSNTVAAGAIGGVIVGSAGGQWVTTGSWTNQAGSTLHVDFSTFTPSTTIAPMKVANFVTNNMTVSVSGLPVGFAVSQSYPLVTWTTSGPGTTNAFTALNLPNGISGYLSISGSTLSLNVTGNTVALTWDTTGGTWDTSTPNWLTSSGSSASYADGTDGVTFDDAVGASGNPVVQLNSAFSPLGVLMKSASHNYTISGTGSIGGAAALTLDPANTMTLILATTNTYTGGTVINAGTLEADNNAALGTGTVQLNGGTLSNNVSATLANAVNLSAASSVGVGSGQTLTLGGGINNSGALTLSGPGGVLLTNANTYTGATTISGGTLTIGGAGTLGGGTYAGAVTNNATLEYRSSASQTLSGNITGTGALLFDSTNATTLTLSGPGNNYSGSTTISNALNTGIRLSAGTADISTNTTFNIFGTSTTGGQLFVNTAGSISNTFTISGLGFSDPNIGVDGAVRLVNGDTLSGSLTTLSNSATTYARIGFVATTASINSETISGPITGGGGLDFYGFYGGTGSGSGVVATNTVTLANTNLATPNNYAGNTYIENNYTAGAGSGGPDYTILKLGANEQIPNGAGAGLLEFTGYNANRGDYFDLNGFNETINGLLCTTAGAYSIIQNTGTNASSLTVGDGNTTSTFSGNIRDGGQLTNSLSLTKIGTGTLTLSGTDTYIGGTTVNNGTLSLSGTGTGSSVTVLSNGVFSETSAGVIAGSGVTFTQGGSGTSTLAGANTYSGATTVTNGTLTLAGAGAVNSSSGIVINGSGATFLQASTTAVTPAVTLTQGTLTGSNTVNTVTVGAGTGGIISNNNGTPGASLTIGALTFNGAATVNTFSASVTAPIVTTTLSANAAGTVTLNPSAAGWTTGTTYNLISYTGSIGGAGFGQFALGTVTGLSARQTAVLGNSGTAITLTINGDSPYWVGDGDGNWNTTSLNNWKLVTAGTYTTFLPNDAVLFNDNADAASPVAVNLDAANVNPVSTTFNNNSKNYVLSSTGGYGISSGILTLSGAGTVIITTTNTYAGGTLIGGGILEADSGSALGLGTVQLNGGTLSNNVSTTLTNAINLSAPSGVGVGAGQTLTLGGVLYNSGALTETGPGTLALAGVNTYTGATAIGGGTLAIVGSGSLGGGNYAATILDNGTLTCNSAASQTLSGTISGTGGINYLGSGGLTLSGTNTYSGGTLLTNGVIYPGNGSAFGTGTVTVNPNAQVFATAASMTIPNAINLNAGYLHVGGGNEHQVTWSGPITLTSASATTNTFSADGGTGYSSGYRYSSSMFIGVLGGTNNGTLNLGSVNNVLNINCSDGCDLEDNIVGANGTIVCQGNILYFGAGTNTFSGTVRAAGGTVVNFYGTGLLDATLDLNAADAGSFSFGAYPCTLGGLMGSRNLTLAGAVSIGNNNNSTTYDGNLTNSGAITKIGSGTLTLSGTNNFANGLIISNGAVALSGNGSIASSVGITVASNALFDVSGLAGTFSLGSLKLGNSAPGAILGGSNNTGSGTLALVYDGVNPSFVVTNGTLTLSATTTITVNNTGATLIPGTYKIIAATTGGSVAGALPGLTMASVVNGPTAGTPALSIVNGELYLTVGGSSTLAPIVGAYTYNGSPQGPTTAIESGSTAPITYSYAGTAADSTTWGPTPVPPTKAGSYTVTATVAADANYFGTTASANFTIGALALTFTGSKTYDGTATATAAQLAFGNNLDGANLTMSGTVTLASATVGSPNISSFSGLSLGGSAAANYTLTGASGSVTITAAVSTATVTVNNSPVIYNGMGQMPTLTLSGTNTVGLLTNILTGGQTQQTNAGTYAVTATFVPADTNYTTLAGLPAGNFTINPATTTAFADLSPATNSYGVTNLVLTGTLSAGGSAYPASGETVTASINGIPVNGTVTNDAGAFYINYNDPSLATNGVAGSPYPITYNYAGNGNLGAASDASTALTITNAPLTITASNYAKCYGETLTYGAGSTAFSSSGLVNNETIGSVTLTATDSPPGTAATDPAGTYDLVPSAATGGTFNPTNYLITYINGALTVNPAPNVYNVLGGGGYCAGGPGADISLSGSDSGVTYTLFGSASNVVTSIDSTGGPLDFGPQAVADTYTVVASVDATGCAQPMNGSATVTINPVPAAPVTVGGSGCGAGPVSLSAMLGTPGDSLTWYSDAGLQNQVAAGTSYTTPSLAVTTTYYVTETSPSGCASPASPVTATVNPAPVVSAQPASSTNCAGNAASFTVTTSDGSDLYQWYTNGVALTNGATGNGSTIYGATSATLTYSNAAAADTVTNLYCVLTSTDGCAISTTNVALVVNALPNVYNVTGGGGYCAGGPGVDIALDGSDSGVTYTLYGSANNVVSATNSLGGPLDFGPQTVADTYTVVASDDATGCTQPMNGSATVTVSAEATASAGGNQTIYAVNSTAGLGGVVGGGATGGLWSSSGTGTFSPDATTLNATYTPSLADDTAGTVTLTLTSTGQSSPCGPATAQVVVTINPLPVVLTGTRTYDNTATAAYSILTVSNAAPGDDVSVASGSATLASSWVGTNVVTSAAGLTLGGSTAPKYTLTGASGAVVITDPGLPFSITSVKLDNTRTNLVLTWNAVPGVDYQLLNAPNLPDPTGGWVTDGSPISATNSVMSTTRPVTGGAKYYRLEDTTQ